MSFTLPEGSTCTRGFYRRNKLIKTYSDKSSQSSSSCNYPARATLCGIELHHILKKGQHKILHNKPVW